MISRITPVPAQFALYEPPTPAIRLLRFRGLGIELTLCRTQGAVGCVLRLMDQEPANDNG